MDVFAQMLTQLRDIYRKMSPVQRTNLILLVSIVLAFAVAVIMWAGRTDYTLLYANLDPRDAGSIKARLDEMNVEHRVEGMSIYVPAETVYETRLLLANEGLPQGTGVGYEIFGKPGMVMTDYMQKLTYKRALEGELTRTITTLNGIRSARVHLTMPQRSMFREKDTRPTASVVLDMGMTSALDKTQVGGIVHLVASSVEGLRPQDVTIVDSRGNLLSMMQEEGSNLGLSARQTDLVRNVESYLKKKAESMLEPILGRGKAIVQVNAEMNFDKVETTEERFDPESAVARTETRTEESSIERGESGESAGEGAGKEKTREKSTTSYEINRTIEKIMGSVGTIKRLSVAVVVNGAYRLTESDAGKTTREYTPRTPEEKEMFRKLVMNAVGFSEKRGDTIEVSDAAFDTSQQEEYQAELEAYERKLTMQNAMRTGGAIAGFLLVLALLWMMMKKIAVTSVQSVPLTARVPAGSRAAMMRYGAEAARGIPAPGTTVSQMLEEDETGTIMAELHKQAHADDELRNLAKNDPESVAKLLRSWLTEDEK